MKRLALALSAVLSLCAGAASALPQPTMDQHTATTPLNVQVPLGVTALFGSQYTKASPLPVGLTQSATLTIYSLASSPIFTMPAPTATYWVENDGTGGGLTVSPAVAATFFVVNKGSVPLNVTPAPTATWFVQNTAASGGLTVSPAPTATFMIVTQPSNLLPVAPAPASTWMVTSLVMAQPASNTTVVASVTVAAVTVPTVLYTSLKAVASQTGATLFQSIPANQAFRVHFKWDVSNGAAVTDNAELLLVAPAWGIGPIARLYSVPLTSILGASENVYEGPWMSVPVISSVELNTVSTGSTGNVQAWLELK